MTMRSNQAMRRLAQASVLNLVVLVSPGHSEIIGTDQPPAGIAAEQDRVGAFANRESVKRQLEALGVEPGAAQKRVAAMSDEEAGKLAQKLETAPAGGTLDRRDLLLILLITIVVALAL